MPPKPIDIEKERAASPRNQRRREETEGDFLCSIAQQEEEWR